MKQWNIPATYLPNHRALGFLVGDQDPTMLLYSPAICYWASILDPRKLICKKPLEEELRNWSSSDLKTSTRPYVCGMAVWALH